MTNVARNVLMLAVAQTFVLWLSLAATLPAQEGILGGTISEVGTLDLREFVDIPGAGPLIDLNHAPGDSRLFVVQQDVGIYAVSPDGSTIETFLDSGAGLTLAGRSQNNSGAHSGIRAVAFHPEYQNSTHPGYGKFYTSIMENSVAGPLLGSSPSNQAAQSVLVEWTADVAGTGLAIPSSYREVFRVGLPVYDHPIKRIRFNEYANPGDEDYGLLYIAHGDAGTQSGGTGQVGDNALGKLLRIDPLDPDAAGAATYSIPATNPFLSDGSVLDEVYAQGFRNPHNFDWQLDSMGTPRLILADIGQNAIEELNLVEAGKNYGWRLREGTRVNTGGGAGDPLAPGVSDTDGFTFPVAQFGHGPGANAIFGGFVIPAGPNAGEYVFGNFSNTRLFHVTLEDLLGQTTEGPSEALTQAAIEEFALITEEGNPTTFAALVGSSRSDARMGRGPDGTIYITNKRNGKIFAVIVPEPSTIAFGFIGFLTLGFVAWRRRRLV